MSIGGKIEAINNKIEQNNNQYNLGRQTAGNVSKHEYLTGKDVLPEKDLSEKAATMKIFEYLPLGKELKAPTDIGKKQILNNND